MAECREQQIASALQRVAQRIAASPRDVVSIKLRPLQIYNGESSQAYIGDDFYRLIRETLDDRRTAPEDRSDYELIEHETGPEWIGLAANVVTVAGPVLVCLQQLWKHFRSKPTPPGPEIVSFRIETRHFDKDGRIAEQVIETIQIENPPAEALVTRIANHVGQLSQKDH